MRADTSATAIYADFAGRPVKFELGVGAIGELERRCNAGIGEILVRLAAHRFFQSDIHEPIRLGLVGGGETAAGAEALMRYNVFGQPLAENLELAARIVEAAVSGVAKPEDDASGKTGTEGTTPPDAPATSPSSTPPAA